MHHQLPLMMVLACVKSPKSDAFPVDAIVTKSITFCRVGVAPPPNTPLILLDVPPSPCLLTLKSPKSCPFPIVAIVTYSIAFVPAPTDGVYHQPSIHEFH